MINHQCLLVEQVFDEEDEQFLGTNCSLFYRKVAVLYDVNCEHIDEAGPESKLFLLI